MNCDKCGKKMITGTSSARRDANGKLRAEMTAYYCQDINCYRNRFALVVHHA